MKRQPTVQDITWFLDLYKGGKLDLDPPYQRKSVWTLKDKRYFLDSIFRDFPCPPIFLHKSLDEDGNSTYHVVDGKQRLQAIFSFVENEFTLDKNFGDRNLDGKSWENVPTEYKKKLWDYVLSIDYINDVSDTKTVNEVFDRVNRNQKKLDRQELRHAKFSGWFVAEAESQVKEIIWKSYGITTTARARRMKDVQFISELMLVILEDEIKGFDQDVIDEKYAEYDDPQDSSVDFDEEVYRSKLFRVQEILAAIEQFNGSITTHAKSLNHFYTLWSFIALNMDSIKDTDLVAKKYDSFMAEVKLRSKDDTIGFIDKKVSLYLTNSLGASTDLKQRTERMRVLTEVLLK